MKKLIVSLIMLLILLGASAGASAAGLGDAMGELNKAADPDTTGLKADLTETVGLIIKGALALVGTIFLLLTIYAGILWMTASGKEEQIETAQKIIKATIIGLFITMAAYAITFFVTSRLSGVGDKTTGATASGCCTLKDGSVCSNIIFKDCDPTKANWRAGQCNPQDKCFVK